jgi:hypothetical protein
MKTQWGETINMQKGSTPSVSSETRYVGYHEEKGKKYFIWRYKDTLYHMETI